ncbi:MAG: ankyrin repeat domain-containing protein [Cyanobacteria bacterium J06600_6]
MVKSGAEINSKTTGELEITALRGAAALGNLEIIRLLVKHRADLNATDKVGIGTPLDFAQDYEEFAAVELS